MRVFADLGIPQGVAATLRDGLAPFGRRVVHARDLPCGPHAADAAWMAALGATGDGWVVLTGNPRIARCLPERLAHARAGLWGIALAPGFGAVPVHRWAGAILRRWPDIEEAVARAGPPCLFELPVDAGAGLRALRP